MQLKVALLTKSWNYITTAVWWLSFLSYFAFVVAYSMVKSLSFYKLFFEIVSSSDKIFWLINLLIPVACLMIDVAFDYTYRMVWPDIGIVIRERESLNLDKDVHALNPQRNNSSATSFRSVEYEVVKGATPGQPANYKGTPHRG